MSYQKIVLGIFGILLVVILVAYGIMLYNASYTDTYPPVQADCPDWWLSKNENNKMICENDQQLGKCGNSIELDNPEWQGADHICKKKKWAEGCDITWDGITNSTKTC